MMKKLTFILSAILLIAVNLAAETLESSPWVGWRKGYEFYDKAASCKEKNQLGKALENYMQSREYFNAIRRNFPQWNKSVVEGRIRLCDNEIKSLQKLVRPARRTPAAPVPQQPAYPAAPQYQQPQPPAGNYRYQTPAPAEPYQPRSNYNYQPSGSGSSSGRLYIEMQSEIDQYRQKLRNALIEIDTLQHKLRQSEARSQDVDGILRDYRLLQEKYSLLEVQYKNAVERSVTGDRNRYENQLMTLQIANDEAIKRARQLEETIQLKDNEYAVSRAEVLKLKDDLQKMSSENLRLQRETKLQSSRTAAAAPANAELSDKIKVLESELQRKDQRIDRLMKLLSDNPGDSSQAGQIAEAEIKRLRSEIDQLKKTNQSEPELRRNISTLTADISNHKQQLAELNALLKVRENELNNTRSSLQKARDAEQVTKKEMITLSRRTETLEKELKAYSDRYNALEKRHQDRLNADAVSTEKREKERQAASQTLLAARSRIQALNDELGKLKAELATNKTLMQSSRTMVIDLKAKQHSSEIELKKMAALQKAYDELKAKFNLFNQASNSDVLSTLNRIPGLEESLKRYEKENNTLLNENASLKRQLRQKSGKTTGSETENFDLERIETLLADARSAEARGNQEIAVWGYRQVLLREPENQEAIRSLGKIYLALGKYDDAHKLLEKALRNAPADEKIINSCARALIGKRNYDAALKLISQFSKNNAAEAGAELLLTEALACSRSGKNLEAEKTFKKVLKLQPGNAEAAYELALLLSADSKRRKEASEFYMLAKNNGIAVDSYLEEILRSFSANDQATRNFLLANSAEAMLNGDMSSAAWYLAEVKKLYTGDREYTFMQAVYYIMNKQSLEILKLFGKNADDREKLLCATALMLNEKYSDAEKMLSAVKKLSADAIPEALKKFIRQEMEKSPVNSAKHKTCENILQKVR